MGYGLVFGRCGSRKRNDVETSTVLEVKLQAVDQDGMGCDCQFQLVAGLDRLSRGRWAGAAFTCVAPASDRVILTSAAMRLTKADPVGAPVADVTPMFKLGKNPPEMGPTAKTFNPFLVAATACWSRTFSSAGSPLAAAPIMAPMSFESKGICVQFDGRENVKPYCDADTVAAPAGRSKPSARQLRPLVKARTS